MLNNWNWTKANDTVVRYVQRTLKHSKLFINRINIIHKTTPYVNWSLRNMARPPDTAIVKTLMWLGCIYDHNPTVRYENTETLFTRFKPSAIRTNQQWIINESTWNKQHVDVGYGSCIFCIISLQLFKIKWINNREHNLYIYIYVRLKAR